MRKMTKEQREHIEWLMSLTPKLTIEHYIGEEPAYVGGLHETGGYIWRYNDYVSNTFGLVFDEKLLSGESNFDLDGCHYEVFISKDSLWISKYGENFWEIKLRTKQKALLTSIKSKEKTILDKLTIPKLDRIINAIPYESKIDKLFKDRAKELWEKYKTEGKMDWCEDRDI